MGFYVNDELNTVDVWGQRMGRTKKLANVASHPQVALVIDDLASVTPWIARGIEIRGLGRTPQGPSIHLRLTTAER